MTSRAASAANDRKIVLEHLQLADRHVAEGEHRISRQHRVIARLRAKGEATTTAEWFLGYLRASRLVHLVSRSRLHEKLASLDRHGGTPAPVPPP